MAGPSPYLDVLDERIAHGEDVSLPRVWQTLLQHNHVRASVHSKHLRLDGAILQRHTDAAPHQLADGQHFRLLGFLLLAP